MEEPYLPRLRMPTAVERVERGGSLICMTGGEARELIEHFGSQAEAVRASGISRSVFYYALHPRARAHKRRRDAERMARKRAEWIDAGLCRDCGKQPGCPCCLDCEFDRQIRGVTRV